MIPLAIATVIINQNVWVFTSLSVTVGSSEIKKEGTKYPAAIPNVFALAPNAVA